MLFYFFEFSFWGSEIWARETDISSIQIEQKPKEQTSAYTQLYSFEIQYFQPESLKVDNGTYIFKYADSTGQPLSSWMFNFGWSPKIFEWNGAFYIEEQVVFSLFQGGTPELSSLPQLSNTSYSLFLFGLGTRLMYAATWFPLKSVIPFIDGGYQYSVLFQSGSNGLEAAQSGVGNPVGSLGLRFWLNRRVSKEGGLPFFITLRLNRIFPGSGDVNLGATTLAGGISLGL